MEIMQANDTSALALLGRVRAATDVLECGSS
jgi:hypothetical protein